ncbi:MAG TPA: molybdenum cofactor biosynthesis protein MoaE [Acidimicrobiales bacterium]|nr:molybdenum cofactor biosynthesis protein MoaE [Acidimicrobiales bacterium]
MGNSGAPEAKVLTVSDSVAGGTAEDRAGDALQGRLERAGFAVVARRVVPDGRGPVAQALADLADGFCGVVVTTGGTGFGPRDHTPEGTLDVVERAAPGLAEAMRAANPLGRLSRAAAGTVGRCLVVNTPGSPGGAVECLEAVVDVLPHAVALLGGDNPHPHPHGGPAAPAPVAGPAAGSTLPSPAAVPTLPPVAAVPTLPPLTAVPTLATDQADQTAPPSGDDWVTLGHRPLPVAAAVAWATVPGCGAVVTFAGTVRDHAEGRPGVEELTYEAYEGPAVQRMGAVVAEARRRWGGLGRVAVLHRLGRLAVCDVAVVVVASAPHREEAFDAARFVIDTVKETVPIWKFERWSGGAGWGTCAHDVRPV